MTGLMTNVTIEFHSKKDYHNFLKRVGAKKSKKLISLKESVIQFIGGEKCNSRRLLIVMRKPRRM